MRKLDLLGVRFGRLVVTALTEERRDGRPLWRATCDCGRETIAKSIHLSRGYTRSCGCLQRDAALANAAIAWTKCRRLPGAPRSAGPPNHPEYQAWQDIRKRTLNPANKSFRHYGGRGITVCERWRDSFAAFLADVGPRPTPKHSIDRIDNDGNYEPGNCRWTTWDVQVRNRRPRQRRAA